MWKKWIVAVSLVCAMGWVGACGGSGGDGGGSDFSSSFSGSKSISDLSTSERVEMCESSNDYIEDQLPMSRVCRLVAHFAVNENATPSSDSEAKEVCKQAKSTCVDQYSGSHLLTSGCSNPGGDSCGVKVSQYESCVSGQVEVFDGVIKDLPKCSDVSADYYENFDPSKYEDRSSKACDEFAQKCPNFGG